MGRIVLVSNRVADLSKASQAGGVAVAIADTLRSRKGFGSAGAAKSAIAATSCARRPTSPKSDGTTIATLPLSAREHDEYYTGYSNNVLWPVFHSRLDIAQFEAGYYQRYLDVNKRFAQALRPLLKPDDTIWVHDYHMIPLGMELRALGVTNPIGFFLHIPVPPAQTFLAIPEHRELARGLASYDLIGLQTKVDVGNLIDYLQDGVFGRILQDGRIRAFDRELSIASFPVGIDVDSFVGLRPKRSQRAARLDHPPLGRRPARLHQGPAAEVSRFRPLPREVSRLPSQGDFVANRAADARDDGRLRRHPSRAGDAVRQHQRPLRVREEPVRQLGAAPARSARCSGFRDPTRAADC